MKKEKFKITIKAILSNNQFKPHYLSSEREFEIEGSRSDIVRALETMEKNIIKKYPVSLDIQGVGEKKTSNPELPQ